MDAESLAQIEQIVTTAVSGAETKLRDEVGALGASLRGEFHNETQALGASLREELGGKMEALGTSLREEFRTETQALGTSLREELGGKIEEAKRHSGVLYEDVLHRLDLVVEGHQGLYEGLRTLREQVAGLDAKIEHESLETRSLIQLLAGGASDIEF